MKTVVVLSTLDTKGRETAFLGDEIVRGGCRPVLVDMGVVGVPSIAADVTRERAQQLNLTAGQTVYLSPRSVRVFLPETA